ncbi:flotillin family protein [Alkalicoccus halolimnae]|uniref:Flotillin family protein n=1 Tax=Alkalicoccus halolimnae TaxID=1667239 RepID=A0A5C7FKG2_9BACI|nr:flotillin family protein [Alkalicoccus halolimnae]TXF86774.1 flotillin family protein [Alkalicoccus halolimnae]
MAIIYGGIALFVLLVAVGVYFLYMKIRYRTARSNEALIITGPNLGDEEKETNIFSDEEGRSMKIIRGGGVLLKRFQTSTPVNLTSFQQKLTTPRVYTDGGVPIIADAIVMVKVADHLKGIANYAEQFLGKDQDEIEREISEVLNGNLRAILSKMTVEGINADREGFASQVTEVAQSQLDRMGFHITALTLTDLRDADEENGYLENLGRPQIAKVRKEAEVAEAESRRETRISRAKTEEEAKKSEYESEISMAEARKEKDIRDASIKEDTERARAKSEQAYDLEKAVLDRNVKDEELNTQFMERERSVKLEEEENKVRRTKLDADYYETTKQAEARAKSDEISAEAKAKADKIAKQAQAQIRVEEGKADAEVTREKGNAAAEIRVREGNAEAQVIREKGEAEAEARRLLADAMAEHGEAVIREKLIEALPKVAAEFARPLSNIDSVKVIDSGSGEGMNTMGSSVARNLMGMQEPVKEATGIDIAGLVKDFTGDKLNKLKENISQMPVEKEAEPAAASEAPVEETPLPEEKKKSEE